MRTANCLLLGGLFFLLSSTTASAQFRSSLQRLDAGTGVGGDYFGFNLDLWGDTLAVGAMRGGGGDGRVHVFEQSQTGWQRTAVLSPPLAQRPFFGFVLRLVGDTIIVGDYVGQDATNAFHVYERTGTEWDAVQSFRTSGAPGERALLLAMQPDIAIVGAPWAHHPLAAEAGCVYVFERQGGRWVETDQLWSSRPFEGQHFGGAGDLSGNTLAIAEDTGPYNLGAIEVFRRTPGEWVQEGTLRGSDTEAGDQFGFKVDLDRDEIVVGAPDADGAYHRQGAAYVFERTSAGWVETRKIEPEFTSMGWYGNRFGRELSLFGDQLLIGAGMTDDGGQARLYRRSEHGIWVLQRTFSGVHHSVFGASVDLNERWLVIGAPDLFSLADGPKVYAFEYESDELGSRYCDGRPNSTGARAHLSVFRDASLVGDGLQLATTGLPVGVHGLFLAAPSVGFLPWFGGGRGNLCLGTGLTALRGPISQALTGDGISTRIELGDSRLGAWLLSGRTLHFQLWYRDHDPMATTNTSDAVAVRFR